MLSVGKNNGLLATILAASVIFAGGCGSMIKGAAAPVIGNLTAAVMKQKDPELVRDGAPAYLLLMDGLLEGADDDSKMLAAAAQLYSSYCSAFLGDQPMRAQLMSIKARSLAFRAAALEIENFSDLADKPYEEFLPLVEQFKAGDEAILFLVISTWVGDIQANRQDWSKVAELAKVEALNLRLIELDETYFYGSAHLLMGALKTLLPPALGGKPEEARVHFERAIEIGDGRFLQSYVIYAEKYARLLFEKDLHDHLLQKALDTPADIVPELTLVNTLAQRRAAELLKESDDFF